MRASSGDSNQSWLEMPYAPPLGYTLQHQGSGVSQQGLLTNQGYHEPGNGPQGLVNGPQGLFNGLAKNNLGFRHQRQTDNPFVDERWPFTPMAAEPNNGGHAPYGNENYQHVPFTSRATSAAVGPLARMGSTGLIRFGSGDQYAHGIMSQPGSLPDHFGAPLMRQASSPVSGMPWHGPAVPWGSARLRQELAPGMTASESAALGNTLVMHGPHSLLERPGPGEQAKKPPTTGVRRPCIVPETYWLGSAW